MTTKEEFENAAIQSKELTQRPSNEDLLKLYSLFKQASEGDVRGERPAGFDFKGAAKYDAWESIKGTSSEDAMAQYVALVGQLHVNE
ncbi:MAG: acyl-CoA-binding protein [Cyclobacteriaceae bacterium]|nr:acyl-CoA-binding protein [Cyclobacteriaceae bacterium]